MIHRKKGFYGSSRRISQLDFRDENNKPIHQDARIIYALRFASIPLWTGYRWRINRSLQSIPLTLGLQCQANLGSRLILDPVVARPPQPLFEGENIANSIYAGGYFEPGWYFSLSGKRSSPWRFAVYLRADLLYQFTARSQPIFLWGGGLGASYRLGDRPISPTGRCFPACAIHPELPATDRMS